MDDLLSQKFLLSPEELDALPDLEWLINGILPEHSFCVLYGEPGAGKTFVALAMVLACANANPWLNRKTRHARILYLAAEGVRGLKYRVQAYRHEFEIKPGNLQFCAEAIQLAEQKSLNRLADALKAIKFIPDIIVIDTLARCSVGKDENSAKDMGEVVAGIDALKHATGATIIAIHHTRKDGGAERGSSVIRGAADVMIECKKPTKWKNIVTLSCSKMKDDEPFKPIEIALDKVELPNGKTSLIAARIADLIERVPHGHHGNAAEKHMEVILGILEKEFGDNGAIHSELKKACAPNNMSGSTFDRAWQTLKDSGRMRYEGEGRGTRYFAVGVSTK